MISPQWESHHNQPNSPASSACSSPIPAPIEEAVRVDAPPLIGNALSSTELQSVSRAVDRRSTLLDASTPLADTQCHSSGDSGTCQTSSRNMALQPPRLSSPRPKKVALHPDTEDNWMLASRVPKLCKQDSEALETGRRSNAGDDDSAPCVNSPMTHHLTYQEPAPRPEEDPPGDSESTNFDTLIIITSPTGKDCVYGVTPEMAARIQIGLISAQAKPLCLSQPSTSLKRKAGESQDKQLLSKRMTPLHEPPPVDVDEVVAKCALPVARPSSSLKRKAQDNLEEHNCFAKRLDPVLPSYS